MPRIPFLVVVIGAAIAPSVAPAQLRWRPVPLLKERRDAAMAYDAARKRTILFGGSDFGGRHLADTWAWNGQAWARLEPATSPTARFGHRMVYDVGRNVIVLFGGWDGQHRDDTWEWNGQSWSRRNIAGPPARSHHGLAYDVGRRRVVLFGGSGQGILSDTWEYDGTAWRPASPSANPGARANAAMAFDPVRNRVVLHGGVRSFSQPLPIWSDTWEWDGANWSQCATTGPALYDHGIAFASLHGGAVLFGGMPGTVTVRGVWRWSGTAWIRIATNSGPDGRAGHAFSCDSDRGALVAFGGVTSLGRPPLPLDTWELVFQTWVRLVADPAPPVRSGAPLALDPGGQGVLLFGGSQVGVAMADTWRFEGGRWRDVSPTVSPPPRFGARMALDAARQRVVLFGGGAGAAVRNDTWEWDGKFWAAVRPSGSPPPRQDFAMSWDARRKVVVVFGGRDSRQLLGDTWEYDGWVWRQVSAPGPSAGIGAMAYDAARGVTVIFYRASAAHNRFETWEYDGSAWRQRQPRTVPDFNQPTVILTSRRSSATRAATRSA